FNPDDLIRVFIAYGGGPTVLEMTSLASGANSHRAPSQWHASGEASARHGERIHIQRGCDDEAAVHSNRLVRGGGRVRQLDRSRAADWGDDARLVDGADDPGDD